MNRLPAPGDSLALITPNGTLRVDVEEAPNAPPRRHFRFYRSPHAENPKFIAHAPGMLWAMREEDAPTGTTGETRALRFYDRRGIEIEAPNMMVAA